MFTPIKDLLLEYIQSVDFSKGYVYNISVFYVKKLYTDYVNLGFLVSARDEDEVAEYIKGFDISFLYTIMVILPVMKIIYKKAKANGDILEGIL